MKLKVLTAFNGYFVRKCDGRWLGKSEKVSVILEKIKRIGREHKRKELQILLREGKLYIENNLNRHGQYMKADMDRGLDNRHGQCRSKNNLKNAKGFKKLQAKSRHGR